MRITGTLLIDIDIRLTVSIKFHAIALGRVRRYFANSTEQEKREIDINWLSKLDPVVDEKKKTIILKACNSFVKKFIEENYLNQLKKGIAIDGFAITELTA